MKKKIERRNFLKTMGGVVSGLALGSFAFKGSAFAKAEKGPIKWGLLDTMSGTFGGFGKGNGNGTKLAIKEINDKGGIMGRPIELLIEDEEANTEITARKARKLIMKDKVDVIQGAASTSTTTVMGKICGEHKVIHFNCEFDSKTVLEARNMYTFNIVPICEELERASMIGTTMLFKPDEIKRWYVFYPDYSYGRDMRDIYKREFAKWVPGAELVGIGAHPLGEADYSTHILKILETKPDVVVSTQWAGDALNFIKQAAPTGFFEKIKMFRLNCASTIAIVALKDKMPSVYATTEQGQPYLPVMKKWRDAYFNYHGEWPTTECGPAYYDAVYMYKRAVEKAKTTKSDAVAAALENMDYVGPSGKRKIRKDHQADCDHIILGKLIPSNEFESKVWDPNRMAKIPYEKFKLSNKELIELGCKFCVGRE